MVGRGASLPPLGEAARVISTRRVWRPTLARVHEGELWHVSREVRELGFDVAPCVSLVRGVAFADPQIIVCSALAERPEMRDRRSQGVIVECRRLVDDSQRERVVGHQALRARDPPLGGTESLPLGCFTPTAPGAGRTGSPQVGAVGVWRYWSAGCVSSSRLSRKPSRAGLSGCAAGQGNNRSERHRRGARPR